MNKYKYKQGGPVNATLMSIITSSPSEDEDQNNYIPEMLGWTLMNLNPSIKDPKNNFMNFGKEESYKNYISGDTFGDLIYTIIMSRTHLIYVDALDFIAPYFINSLVSNKNFNFKIVPKIDRTCKDDQISMFNHDTVFYSIQIKFGIIKYNIKLLSIKLLTRNTGFGLLGQFVDYTRLNKNNIKYAVDLSYKCCINLQPLVWKLFKSDGAGAVTITQYSKNILTEFCVRDTGLTSEQLFPDIGEDVYNDIKDGYRGGLLYISNYYKNKLLHDVKSYDCNKLYSFQMHEEWFPCGQPTLLDDGSLMHNLGVDLLWCEQKHRFYLINKYNKLFITHVKVVCDVRDEYIPCFDSRDHAGADVYRMHLGGAAEEDEDGNVREQGLELVLTNVELAWLLESYTFKHKEDLKISGSTYLFDRCRPFSTFVEESFRDYISCEPGSPEQKLSKLVMECAYGGFGTKPIKLNHTLKADNYKLDVDEVVNSDVKIPYLPVAMFITAYARVMMAKLAHANYYNLVYIDTDSLHIIGNVKPKGLTLGGAVGQFKIESDEADAKYFGYKQYIYKDACSGDVVAKLSGLSRINNLNITDIDEEVDDASGFKACYSLTGCYYIKYNYTMPVKK